MRAFAILSVLLLSACGATRPAPFVIERGGTLPPESYSSLERQAAAAPVVAKVSVSDPAPQYPEPHWVYSFAPGFDPTRAPLQIGPFDAAPGKKEAEVAAALPKQLAETLGAAHIFPAVGLTPTEGGYVLTGKVLRANGSTVGAADMAATRIEAKLMRQGVLVGAMQVNVLQMDVSPASLLVTMIYSAMQGSRASFVSTKFREMFRDAAAGHLEGIDATSTNGANFVFTPKPAS